MEENIIKDLLKSKYSSAMKFALLKHANQKRLEGTPYIFHPVRVYYILSKIFRDDSIDTRNILQSALLHDTIEDTNTDIMELNNKFNGQISSIVQELTIPKNITHIEKGILLAERVPQMSPQALTIKLADRNDNISDLNSLSIKRTTRYLNETSKIIYNLEKTNKNLDEPQKYLLNEIHNKLDSYSPPIYNYIENENKK